MTQAAFTNMWDLEDIPACDVGMILLKRWADSEPFAWPELPSIAWREPPMNLHQSPEWRAYDDHRGSCGNLQRNALLNATQAWEKVCRVFVARA